MKFLYRTCKDLLTLSAGEGVHQIEWYVDVVFGVHPDYKGHTGAVMRFRGGQGCPIQKSVKQRLNTSSSMTCELVGVDDLLPKIIWTLLFLADQGYMVSSNEVFQDNTSTILLEKNGKKSSGECTRALNVRYFMITDHKEKGDVSISYCPTEKMLGDYHTKPLQGKKFHEQRKEIMGLE